MRTNGDEAVPGEGLPGRGIRVRTRDLRIWNPLLYQLSYTPALGRGLIRDTAGCKRPCLPAPGRRLRCRSARACRYRPCEGADACGRSPDCREHRSYRPLLVDALAARACRSRARTHPGHEARCMVHCPLVPRALCQANVPAGACDARTVTVSQVGLTASSLAVIRGMKCPEFTRPRTPVHADLQGATRAVPRGGPDVDECAHRSLQTARPARRLRGNAHQSPRGGPPPRREASGAVAPCPTILSKMGAGPFDPRKLRPRPSNGWYGTTPDAVGDLQPAPRRVRAGLTP